MKYVHTKTAAVVIVLSTTIRQSQSFLFSRHDVHPNLFDLANAQTGTVFQVGLEVKTPLSPSRLYIDGMTLELQSSLPPKDKQFVSLPGISGKYPEVSTGPLHLEMKSEGRFISMDGTQTMKTEKEAWEMIWVADRPSGSIICGFHLNKSLKRNDAILPSGHVFLNFRVFTPKGLHAVRNEKMMYERRLAENLERQKDALEKMNRADNPISKAIHFRDAAAASEIISVMHTDKYESVPCEDEDVIKIGDGLLVAKKGSMWTTVHEPSFLGKKEINHYLGGAFLTEM